MTTENLFINNGAYRKTIEAIRERLPQLDVVAALTLVVETINPIN